MCVILKSYKNKQLRCDAAISDGNLHRFALKQLFHWGLDANWDPSAL